MLGSTQIRDNGKLHLSSSSVNDFKTMPWCEIATQFHTRWSLDRLIESSFIKLLAGLAGYGDCCGRRSGTAQRDSKVNGAAGGIFFDSFLLFDNWTQNIIGILCSWAAFRFNNHPVLSSLFLNQTLASVPLWFHFRHDAIYSVQWMRPRRGVLVIDLLGSVDYRSGQLANLEENFRHSARDSLM